ncbi:Premnaspirodiene oxygenase [Apostasia shenzhenica]|uniref:Premnaspirodiene oxygenase n=1 Tax=Apostasia shenzhenica TaxID=1088818 RepID=A0A2I0AIY3_9ASPA|nr:Premnaspirodiene oxygenase [Apostasia shenzhenica]
MAESSLAMEAHSFFLLEALGLSLFLFFLLKIFVKNPKPNLPPGPRKLPIIGNIHQLAGELPHRRLGRLAQKYGPLFHLKLGETDFIVASSSETAVQILKTHDLAFASRPALMAIKTIAYDCAGMGFSPYGAYWRQLRRICSGEVLSSSRVKSFGSIRREEAGKLVETIAAAAGSPVNMTEMFLALTNNHVTRAAFGKECRSQARFLRAMKETIKLAPVLSLVDLFPSMAFLSAIDGSKTKMKKLHREMDAILDEIIADHRGKRSGEEEEEEEEEGDEMQEDLVDVLLRIQQKGELEIPLQMHHIKAVILRLIILFFFSLFSKDMLVAATETTSSTLDWVMTELVRHPEAMHEVQLELRRSLKGKTEIQEGDIEELHYLKRVIKETLRLHPPLPLLLPRTCSENVEVLGYTVPSKSRVMVNAWAVGRDPKIWKDPEKFWPERFEGSGVDFRGGNFEFIPFGGGRRMCPGLTFALAGMELFLARLLYQFEWELPGGRNPEELDMEEEFDGSLRRKNHLYLLAFPCSSLEN